MNRFHSEYVLDDDDPVAEGTMFGEELEKASKEFQRLRSESRAAWEKEQEERSI